MSQSPNLAGKRRVKNKFFAVKTTVDGVVFDSKTEAARWQQLRLLERAGEVSGLERQVKFAIAVNGQHICNYTADFAYVEAGARVVEDSKGQGSAAQRDFKLVCKLMRAVHGIDVRITGVRA